MKKSLVLGVFIFLVIINIILVRTTILYKTKIDKQVFKVYSFEGENSEIRIRNGLIIISPNKETVSGGKIQYIGNKQDNIQSYSETISLHNKGNVDVVLSKSVSFEDDDKGISFHDEFLLNEEIGEISSKKLFNQDDLNIIKDNLYFSLNYSTIDGQTGNYTIKLEVKEFNMDQTK